MLILDNYRHNHAINQSKIHELKLTSGERSKGYSLSAYAES